MYSHLCSLLSVEKLINSLLNTCLYNVYSVILTNHTPIKYTGPNKKNNRIIPIYIYIKLETYIAFNNRACIYYTSFTTVKLMKGRLQTKDIEPWPLARPTKVTRCQNMNMAHFSCHPFAQSLSLEVETTMICMKQRSRKSLEERLMR